MGLTAIIPTLNEEYNIEDAIKCVSFADEIIVIDSFSTDNTVAIARKHGAKIIQREFDNFSSQKNYAIKNAANGWILVLDADERISRGLREEIIILLKNQPRHDAWWIRRDNYFMGRKVRFSGWQNDKVIRLFRKSNSRYNKKLVHEEVETSGTYGFLKNKLIHNTYSTLFDYKEKLKLYAELQAHELFQKNKRTNAIHFTIKPGFRFIKHYIIKQGFRDGKVGLTISKLQANAVYMRYKKLKQLNCGNYEALIPG